MLSRWLARPHLQAWWREQDTSLSAIRDKYLPRLSGTADARPFIAWLDGQAVGYIQVYDAAAGDPDWWPDSPGPGVVGIDQFLADEDRLGQGLGSAMVRAFVKRLFDDPAVTQVRVDPRPDNARAIRCYEKCGFRIVGPISTPDGPAVMMVLKRQWVRSSPGTADPTGPV